MGLDLVVLGKPKIGHESEFASGLAKVSRGDEMSEAETSRFLEITTQPYESLGAPQVGFSPAADEWIVNMYREKDDEKPAAQIIDENRGFYVLRLLDECDGIPQFSHANLYDGVDDTSFRGAFLDQCKSFLDKANLDRAWTKIMSPDEAVNYGQALLAAATQTPSPQKSGFFNKLFSGSKQPISFEEQREILKAAGKWYMFWGNRGHHIQAYY